MGSTLRPMNQQELRLAVVQDGVVLSCPKEGRGSNKWRPNATCEIEVNVNF